MAPRTRYAMVVTSAVVGAGVVAFAAGSALPQQLPTDGATTSLDKVSTTAAGSETEAADDLAANQARSASVARASRSQIRAGAPTPKLMAEWVRPARGPLSSLYGARWGTTHFGLDIASAYGSPIYAASDGVVEFAGWNGGYGKLVILDHGSGLTTRYGHNSKLAVDVGQKVQAGDIIAYTGSTGYSTGAHCHFEVRRDGNAINPLPFMEARGVRMEQSGVDTSR
jgi:murein DD-endopeptidase MepM/ murein hydrolase activator NlpD